MPEKPKARGWFKVFCGFMGLSYLLSFPFLLFFLISPGSTSPPMSGSKCSF